MSSINKNSSTPLGCGMNCKIRVTSVMGGETVSPTDRKLSPAGRNTGIQSPHKGCRLWIKTSLSHLIVLAKNMLPLLENGHLKMLCVNGQEVAADGIKVVDAEDYDIVYWESNERKK